MFGRHNSVQIMPATPDVGLRFDTTDLRHLVKSGYYLDLPELPGATQVVRLDKRPDLVLRWEMADPEDAVPPIPKSALELADHNDCYERELRHLAKLGISALSHQTYIASGSLFKDTARLFTVVEYVEGLQPMFHMPEPDDDTDTQLPFPDTFQNRQRAQAFGTALSEYLAGCLIDKRQPIFGSEASRQYADLKRDGTIATLFDLGHEKMPLDDIHEAQARIEALMKLSMKK